MILQSGINCVKIKKRGVNMSKIFYAKQKLFSFKDKFKFFNEQDEIAYQAKSPVFSLRKTFYFNNANEQLQYVIKKKLLAFLPTYKIYDDKEQEIGFIQTKFQLIGSKIIITINNENYLLEGNILNYNYVIKHNDETVAVVNKNFFRIADSYKIEILNDYENEALILAMVLVFDNIYHDENKGQN